MLKPLLLLTLLLSALTPVLANDDPREDELSRAILSLMDADDLREAGDTDQAAEHYREALHILQDLREQHPDFKTRIVDFRIETLQNTLEELDADPDADTPERRELPPPPEDNYERLYVEAKAEALRNANRMLDIERRNLDLQMNLRERTQTVEKQRELIAELRRELESTQNEAERAARRQDEEIRSLQRFNNLLQDRANETEQENEALQATVARVREEEAQTNFTLQQTRGELADTREQLERTREQTNEEIEELGIRLLDRAEEVRSLRAENEALRETNEVLREQTAGLPLLEETVIELNRRLNAQTEDLEQLDAARTLAEEADAERREVAAAAEAALARDAELVAEIQALRDTVQKQQNRLEAHLAQRVQTLNEITRLRRTIEQQQQELEALQAGPPPEPSEPSEMSEEPEPSQPPEPPQPPDTPAEG